ncbi:hypothetical protein F5Y13DRAFT_182436 [Hypoxylon sp. FL1857]|nr:hypothetical protein F5Y13DRAFT_182436 [Hypoxylon sp. FL1857]
MYYAQEFTSRPPKSLDSSGYPHVVKAILKSYGLKSFEMLMLINKNPKRAYNTFVWKVFLQKPAFPCYFDRSRPYTMKPPLHGVCNVIVRIFNPNAHELVQANRVQNEVAAMHLIREGLKKAGKGLEDIVPAVYAWEPAAEDGSKIDLGRDTLMAQLAEIVKLIQDIELPATVTRQGGLTIDDDGNIVTGKASIFGGGPWSSYTEFWVIQLMGLRERVDTLIQKLDDIFVRTIAIHSLKLIHGGITMENILFDPKTKKITALLDFDRACVSHPSLEYLLSFRDFGGNIVSNQIPHLPLDEDLIDRIVFNKFRAPLVLSMDTEDCTKTIVFWECAMAWDNALLKAGALKPSAISGIREISLVARIAASLWPSQLEDESLTSEQACNIMSEAWGKIDMALGYLDL